MSDEENNNINTEQDQNQNEEDQQQQQQENENNEQEQENQDQNQENQENEEEENVEVTDIGINTDELPPEELQKLVENNKELLDQNEISNIDHEVKENNNQITVTKKQLIDELNEKDKMLDMLETSNNELKKKIEKSNEKYKQILEKIEEKKKEDKETNLSNKIKEMEKEIKANNKETEYYKKKINELKNQIEFKTNLERAFSLQSILKQEIMKNNELKNQLNALMRVNGVQMKYINNYEKENQISEKIEILKNEIDNTKKAVNLYQEKYRKQDRFIRLIHEKILSLEMQIKKMKEPKIEKIKLFTKEELKDTLELISKLKNQIKENRNQLNSITKINDDKMHQLLAQNKQIEVEYKENEKINKMLVFKKNELKRAIKNSNMGIVNKKKNKKFLPNKNSNEKYEFIDNQDNNNNIDENNEIENNNNNYDEMNNNNNNNNMDEMNENNNENNNENIENNQEENLLENNENNNNNNENNLEDQNNLQTENQIENNNNNNNNLEENNQNEENENENKPEQKLFSKNPNKKESEEENNEQNEEQNSEENVNDPNDSNAPENNEN
jgi:hypothetical protein